MKSGCVDAELESVVVGKLRSVLNLPIIMAMMNRYVVRKKKYGKLYYEQSQGARGKRRGMKETPRLIKSDRQLQ